MPHINPNSFQSPDSYHCCCKPHQCHQKQPEVYQQTETSERSFSQSANGLEVFQSTITQRFESFNSQPLTLPAYSENEVVTSDSVANKILMVFEQRLLNDAQLGVSNEDMHQRLDAGIEGFKQGFAEAKDKIEALGLLDENIESAINHTYDRVLNSVEGLRDLYIDNPVSHIDESESDSVTTPVSTAQTTTSIQNTVSASYGKASIGQMNSFQFEVETADGDVVTIDARSRDLYVAEYRAGSFATANNAGAFESFKSYSEHNSSFDLQVNGELDEGELQALDQLLAKVESLSNDFFTGDVEAAFNQAKNLGYDTSEIVGYSLNLKQTEVQKVAAAYQEEEVSNVSPINPLANTLQPVGNFAKELLEGLELGSRFADPAALLVDLSEKIEQSLYEEQAQQQVAPQENEVVQGQVVDQQEVAQQEVAQQELKLTNEKVELYPSPRFSGFMQELIDSLPPVNTEQTQ